MQFIDLKTQYEKIKPKIKDRINNVLEHGLYIGGPEIKELEELLANFTGAKRAIGVSSGTDALLLALMGLDVSAGDEVITTPFTFFATAEVITLLGAKPVFVDIDKDTYNIDPDKISAAITERTKAIVPVSLYGQCADMDKILDIGAKHNIPVIEDAAQSFGASYKGKRSCSMSLVSCTSFFPAKPLGAYGDAGAVFCNDEELAEKIDQIKSHGQQKRYSHALIGINARLDTIQAAILIEKLAIFEEELASRDQVASYYTELLEGKIRTPNIIEGNTSAWAQYTVEVDNRAEVQASMKSLGVPTAVHYPVPVHMQPAYAHLSLNEGSFPVAEKAASKVMSLPMHPYLQKADQEKVVKALLESI